MLKRTRSTLKGNDGFTILELIVVIAIMGFLVALVAPKLAGVTDSSKTPTCRTNQQRLSEVVSRKIQQDEKLPNELINLIPDDGNNLERGRILEEIDSGTGVNEWVSDGKKEEEAYFSKEFAGNNNLYVHYLSAEEEAELKNLGLVNVINYSTGESKEVAQYGAKEEDPEHPGESAKRYSTVLMVGSGASTRTDDIPKGKVMQNSEFSDPDFAYRIVMGLGDESELIKKGLISTVGSCPTAIQNDKFIDYKNYSIVLPRLKSTVKRLDLNAPKTITADGFSQGTSSSVIMKDKVFSIGEAQEVSKFSIICPEDEKLSDSKVGIWKITKVE